MYTVSRMFTLSWLTGPILDKELRVSSRRRRSYLLRFAYLMLLTIFLILVWLAAERDFSGGSASYRVSRMVIMGQIVIAFLVWFQFCATQIVAITMLSTSISDEIYNRTLGLLMTTPINSFQIVMGKLFSKLLQLLLLLGISLPLFAIVRVFGGVPWDYVLSSLCITITAVLFVSSLSLFFSIFSRRAYVVIIMTIITLGIIFALVPFMAFLAFEDKMPDIKLMKIVFQPNPYMVLSSETGAMFNPRSWNQLPSIGWPRHCGIMLAGSALLIALSTSMVRRVALRQATGQAGLGFFSERRRRRQAKQDDSPAPPKRVVGPAILWKELRSPMLGIGKRRIVGIAVVVAVLILLISSYLLCAEKDVLKHQEIQAMYVAIFGGLAMMFTIILPATVITSEKESRSWPVLLGTTLSDGQILFGKCVGVLRRCLPMWVLMYCHVVVFVWLGYIHPIMLVQLPILVAWMLVFFVGTGLYFSSRFRRTTTAVVANFAFAAIIWGLAPLLMFVGAESMDTSDDFAETYMNYNPVIQGIVLLDATTGQRYAGRTVDKLHYNWIRGDRDASWATSVLMMSLCCYTLAGLGFAGWAAYRFRRSVF